MEGLRTVSEFECACGKTMFSASNNYRGRCPYCGSGVTYMDGMSSSMLYKYEKYCQEREEEDDASDSD